jgi:DNA-binding transcriptional regulator GbsR (MarR family)
MQDKKTDFYSQAHLLVAAIRVYEHMNSRPPTLEDLCHTIHLSIEQVNFICRRLEELDIIEAVEGSYGVRLFIRNHLKIEDIPRGVQESKLEEELKKFQDDQKALSNKIESFQAQRQQKKKDLFAEMEKKLKEELEKKTKKNL